MSGGRLFIDSTEKVGRNVMKKIQVALYDKKGYMPCLVGYLCKKGRGILEARLFSSLEMLTECAEAGNIDVLLAGEEVQDYAFIRRESGKRSL